MSSQGVAEDSLMRLFINIVVVVSFASLMAWLIASMIRNEPDVYGPALQGFARQFQQSAENAHWQWQANGRPQRIMLLHYNEQGQETDRRPVRMTHLGKPWAEANKDGCERLWQSLLNEPMRIDGFKVIAEFFSAEDAEVTGDIGFCRYRLSRGPYFDYDLRTGNVKFEGKS